jgi:hypothetical protein
MAQVEIALLLQIAAACPGGWSVPGTDTRDSRSRIAVSAVRHWRQYDAGSYAPPTAADAVRMAQALTSQGHSIDAGPMQINSKNWPRLGLTPNNVFDLTTNICAGQRVLAELYDIERRVSCRYNTGKPDCTNRYPDLIEAAWHGPIAGAAADVVVPAPPPVMVNALRGGGPPVPLALDGTVNSIIHKRR